MHPLIDQYTDFLISCPGQCSATMMSDVTNGLIGHDQITRLLASQNIDSRALWKMVKPMCHEVSSDEAVQSSSTIAFNPSTTVASMG